MKHEAFHAAYKSILSAVNKHEISRGHNREVSAYLCYLTFAILDYDAPQYIPVSPDEFMYQRMRLYANLSPTDLLNNWLCPDVPDLSENPLFNAFIAFGDLLINSNARKDYHSAPLVLHDFTETVSFGISMLQIVLPLTNGYIEQLISVKEHLTSVADSSKDDNHEISEETQRLYSEARARAELANYKKQQESNDRRKNTLIKVLCVLLAVSALGVIRLLPSHTFRPASSRSPTSSPRITVRPTSTPTAQPSRNANSQAELLNYYQLHYPMVWGYIRKNADDPFNYLQFYDFVWGDLQEYCGDGVHFETLSRYEQSLVNYPSIGSYIYFAFATSREYHSTDQCYTLLKATPIARPATQRYNYSPCSKCVGD